jgi:hypothetical protein
VRRAAFRFIALMVLLSGAGTPGFIAAAAGHRMSPTSIRYTDTQDDRCICCSAGFPAHPVRLRIAAAIVTLNALTVLHPSDLAL